MDVFDAALVLETWMDDEEEVDGEEPSVDGDDDEDEDED